MTHVPEKQIPRFARVPRAALGMTNRSFFLKKKKKDASALVIPSEARDLLLWEHP
jgi:hypothetical protein